MIKVSAVVISMLLLLVAVPSYAAPVDYQDTGGSHQLSVAADWWSLTASNDPNTRVASGLPTFSDNAYVRTGRNDLQSTGTINAKGLQIGGDSIASNPPTTQTVVTATGGTIETRGTDGTIMSENLVIGYRYNGKLVVDGATVKSMLAANPAAGSVIYLGGQSAVTTGTLDVISGEVQFSRIVAAWKTGSAIINQSGGTMRQVSSANTNFGRAATNSTAKATYNLSDGFLNYSAGASEFSVGFSGGRGLFNQTGGSALFVKSGGSALRIGNLSTGTTLTEGEYRLLGGRTTVIGSIILGTGGAPLAKGKLVVNQVGQLDVNWLITSASTLDAVEFIVNSANDFQIVAGGVNLANPSFRITLDSYTPTPGQTWRVVDVGGSGISLPLDGHHPLGDRYDFCNEDGLGWCLYKDTNSDLSLEYLPEPATLTLLGLGGLALLRRKRS